MTKGAGMLETLIDLGLSHHNTIGVGDAENDHTLLETCEIAVAVNNAVEAIRGHADLRSIGPMAQGWPTCFGDRCWPDARDCIRVADRSSWASTKQATR